MKGKYVYHTLFNNTMKLHQYNYTQRTRKNNK